MQCKFLIIKHIVLEDNYTVNEGDFYSLKNLLRGTGFIHKPGRLSMLKTLYILFKMTIKNLLIKIIL